MIKHVMLIALTAASTTICSTKNFVRIFPKHGTISFSSQTGLIRSIKRIKTKNSANNRIVRETITFKSAAIASQLIELIKKGIHKNNKHTSMIYRSFFFDKKDGNRK
jgi:hypothetical protein